jgi:hypothetical protein
VNVGIGSLRLNQGHRLQYWRKNAKNNMYGNNNRNFEKWGPLMSSACIQDNYEVYCQGDALTTKHGIFLLATK